MDEYEPIGPDILNGLPEKIIDSSIEWYRKASLKDAMDDLFKTWEVVDDLGLSELILTYEDTFAAGIETDNYNSDEDCGYVFTQGMFYGVSIIDEWLPNDTWDFVYDAADSLAYELEDLGWPIGDNKSRESRELLLSFGQMGIGIVAGYESIAKACMDAIQVGRRHQDYFIAGAGFMMRLALEMSRKYQEAIHDEFAREIDHMGAIGVPGDNNDWESFLNSDLGPHTPTVYDQDLGAESSAQSHSGDSLGHSAGKAALRRLCQVPPSNANNLRFRPY